LGRIKNNQLRELFFENKTVEIIGNRIYKLIISYVFPSSIILTLLVMFVIFLADICKVLFKI